MKKIYFLMFLFNFYICLGGFYEDHIRLMNVYKLLQDYENIQSINDYLERYAQQEVFIQNLSLQIDALRVEEGYFLQKLENKFKAQNESANGLINVWQMLAYMHNVIKGEYCSNVEEISVCKVVDPEYSHSRLSNMMREFYNIIVPKILELTALMPELLEMEKRSIACQESLKITFEEIFDLYEKQHGKDLFLDSVKVLMNSQLLAPLKRYEQLIEKLSSNLQSEKNNQIKALIREAREKLSNCNKRHKLTLENLEVPTSVLDIQNYIGVFYEYECLHHFIQMFTNIEGSLNQMINDIKSDSENKDFLSQKHCFKRIVFQIIVILNETLNNIQNIEANSILIKLRYVVKDFRNVLEHPTLFKLRKLEDLENSEDLVNILEKLLIDIKTLAICLNNRRSELGDIVCNHYKAGLWAKFIPHKVNYTEIQSQDVFYKGDTRVSKKKPKREKPKKIDRSKMTEEERRKVGEAKKNSCLDKETILRNNCKQRIEDTSTDGLVISGYFDPEFRAYIPAFDHMRRCFNPNYKDDNGNSYPIWGTDILDIGIAIQNLYNICKAQKSHPKKEIEIRLNEDDFHKKILECLNELGNFLEKGKSEKSFKHKVHGFGNWLDFNLRFNKGLNHRPALLSVLSTQPLHLLYLTNLLGDFHYYLEEWLKCKPALEKLSQIQKLQLETIAEELKICRNYLIHDMWRNKERHLDAIVCITLNLQCHLRNILDAIYNSDVRTNMLCASKLVATQKLNQWINNNDPGFDEYGYNFIELDEILENEPDLHEALLIAIQRRHPKLFGRLIYNWYLNINIADEHGNTLMHALAVVPKFNLHINSMLSDLLAAGALPNVRNLKGQTPYDITKNSDLKRHLIYKEPFARLIKADNVHRLDPVLHNGTLDPNYNNQLLENKDTLVNLMDREGSLILNRYLKKCLNRSYCKSSENDLYVVEKLLHENADINQRDYFGNSALKTLKQRYGRDGMAKRIENAGEDGWYADPEMHELLELRIQQEGLNSPFLRVLPPLGDNVLGYTLADHLQVMEDNRHQQARTLLLPYNIMNNHWAGVLIHVPEGENTGNVEVEYYDSLADREMFYKNMHHHVMEHVRRMYPSANFLNPNPTGEFYRQNNLYDCGPMTIENLVLAAARRNNVQMPTRLDPTRIRTFHARLIRDYGIHTELGVPHNEESNSQSPQTLDYLHRFLNFNRESSALAIQLLLSTWITQKYAHKKL